MTAGRIQVTSRGLQRQVPWRYHVREGDPEEDETVTARIYRPARTAMSSGTAKTKHWVLEHAADSAREVDPLMGWTSSDDTQTQVRLRFSSKEEALEYAEEHGIEAVVVEPKPRKPNIRARGYGENFATDRRGAWTH